HGVVMTNTGRIGIRHLPPFLRDGSLSGFRQTEPSPETTARPSPTGDGTDLNLARVEQRYIQLALDRTGGNRTEAAKLLGISRRTMQRKLKEMGLVDG
ncbi:MAG: helix-turn-helix domain-containing protein, partial [Verrucomicrobiota bacterium]